MKRNLILLAGLCFIAVALLPGCTTTTIAPTSTGRMEGSVNLVDMDCGRTQSFKGVMVEILETGINAVSDDTGGFVLQGVPAGYWTIRFSKPGFTEYISHPVEFVGSGTLLLNSILEVPILAMPPNWKTTLTTCVVDTPVSGGSYYFSFPSRLPFVLDSSGDTLTVGGEDLILFLGKTPQINYLDTTSYFAFIPSVSAPNYSPVPVEKWRFGGATSFYMIAYSLPCISGSRGWQISYYLGDTIKTEFVGFGPPSNTIQVTLP